MTFWILTDDTQELIVHSSVCLARPTDDNSRQAPVNLRLLLDTRDEAEGVKREVKYEFEKKILEKLDSKESPSPTLDLEGRLDESSTLFDSGEDDFIALPAPTLPNVRKDRETDKQKKQRFTSLREEIVKAKKAKTEITIDPSDLLGYSFVHQKDESYAPRCTVIDPNEENNLFTLEYFNEDRDVIEYNDLINTINAPDEQVLVLQENQRPSEEG